MSYEWWKCEPIWTNYFLSITHNLLLGELWQKLWKFFCDIDISLFLMENYIILSTQIMRSCRQESISCVRYMRHLSHRQVGLRNAGPAGPTCQWEGRLMRRVHIRFFHCGPYHGIDRLTERWFDSLYKLYISGVNYLAKLNKRTGVTISTSCTLFDRQTRSNIPKK